MTFDVRKYGAKGDGETEDTEAFEAAISAVSKAGSGIVLVPANGKYLIRPINLTSSMELYIQGGATIIGVADHNAWPIIPGAPNMGQGRNNGAHSPRFTSLIHGEHLSDVTIRGDGNSSVLDGNGDYWWDRDFPITKGHLIEFMYSKSIKIHDIAMKGSPFWNNHFFDCDGVHVRGVSISAPIDSDSTDGWDPDSSSNVLIEDSWYVGGDDCVAIKSGWDCYGVEYGKPSVNITVRNLTCHGQFAGIAIGSEMSGGVENVTVSNIRFTMANGAAKIKWAESRGGYVTNVRFQDFLVQGPVDDGIRVDGFYDSRNPSCSDDWKPPAPPRISNIAYVNIDGRDADIQDSSFHFKGGDDSPIEGVYLENVHFPDNGWDCDHVSGTAKRGTVEPWPPCDGIEPGSPMALFV